MFDSIINNKAMKRDYFEYNEIDYDSDSLDIESLPIVTRHYTQQHERNNIYRMISTCEGRKRFLSRTDVKRLTLATCVTCMIGWYFLATVVPPIE